MKWDDVYNKRITPTSEIEANRVLLKYYDAEIFCEGTLSMICGGAKSRKTFCMSLLLEELMNPTEPGFESDFNGEILYFDTEMSPRRVQDVSKRFKYPERVTFISIRQYSVIERYQIIEEGIKRIRPELVVIDGYKELTLDINDQVYSTKLTNKLLEWTTKYNCHITGVLHTNPDSTKPRGALGTEMINKCSLTMHVVSRGPQSFCKVLYSRDKEFPDFAYNINAQGNPKIK